MGDPCDDVCGGLKRTPTISAIAAMAENNIIGMQNQLPWRLPADLRRFKSITTGHTIVMGRKTFEAIGRPLPNRTNIIVTKRADYAAPGCIVTTSIDEALQQIKKSEQNAAFIVGGATIYEQFMPWTSRIYLTIIHHHFCGDAYFPQLDLAQWQETAREDHAADAENPYAHRFVIIERKQDKAR